MGNHNTPTTGFHTNPERINRNGAPEKEWTWTGLIREHLDRLGVDGKSVKDAVTASLIAKAMDGDVAALKEIGNRIDGLPKQTIEHSGEIKGNTIVFSEFKHEADSE